MRLWEDEKRSKAQELIDWLLSVRTDTGGWPIDWVNMIAFAELSYSSLRKDLTQSLIMQILDEMSANNRRTVDDFEEIFEQQIQIGAIGDGKQNICWEFFIPLEVTIKEDVLAQQPQVRVLGKDFSFRSLSWVEHHLGKEALINPTFIELQTGVRVTHIPTVFLSVSACASFWDLAWKNVEPAFSALRGLIELSFDVYRWRRTYGKVMSRRKIPHPLWIIACSEGKTPEWLFFDIDEDSTKSTFELSAEHLAVIRKAAHLIQEEPPHRSTLSLIADCLRLYSQAMDVRLRHLCFLGFWQLAETITNSNEFGGKTERVADRLSWHGTEIGLKGSGYKETLRALGRKRNDIVHRGIHEVEDDDINILKLACEVALGWLIRVYEDLPTIAHIEYYYRLREMNQTDFEAMRECIDYLNREKRNRET